MNSENKKTSDHHIILLNLSDKIALKRSYVILYVLFNIRIILSTSSKNIENDWQSCNIYRPRIYVNKIENWIIFKIKQDIILNF